MDVLEASGDAEGEASEDIPGRKKSRLKPVRSRLLVKIKRKEDDEVLKQSQSEGDIARGVEDSECSERVLGSRAFSHDSIFQAECIHPEPERIQCQESVHGKIRTLQMKLQQQKMHLGPPPLLMPGKHQDDVGETSEDDLSRSPPDDGLTMEKMNKPLLPQFVRPASITSLGLGPAIDFSSPPQATSLLNSSAARHRMSIKPKNQRASVKGRRVNTSVCTRTRSESLNNLERSVRSEQVEKESLIKEIPRVRSYSSQVIRPGETLVPTASKNLPASALKTLQTTGHGIQLPCQLEIGQNNLSTLPSRQNEVPPSESAFPSVPTDRKEKEHSGMFNSSKLTTQNNQVATDSPTPELSLPTTPEMHLVEDEEKSNTLKIDTLTKCDVSTLNIEGDQSPTPGTITREDESKLSSFIANTPHTVQNQALPLVSSLPAVFKNSTQTETTKSQRTLSTYKVSSNKNQKPQSTAGFTIGPGLKKDTTRSTEASGDLKTDLTEVEKNLKDHSTDLARSSREADETNPYPVMPTKLVDLSKNFSGAKGVEEVNIGEKKEIQIVASKEGQHEMVEAVETTDDVASETMVEREREATNAFGVKLRSTNLSLKFRLDKALTEDRPKHQNSESTPQALGSVSVSTSDVRSEEDCSGSSTIHGKPEDPSLQTNGSLSLGLSSRSQPEKISRNQQRDNSLKQIDPQNKNEPLLSREGTGFVAEEPVAVPSQETPPSISSEVSWMEMAREKTRSLQQLFASRLPDFPSLQSRTTLSTTQTQTSSSQTNPNITQNVINKSTNTQPTGKPLETKQLSFTQLNSPVVASQPSENSTQLTNNPPSAESPREVQLRGTVPQKETQTPVKSTLNIQSLNTQILKQPPPIQQPPSVQALSQATTHPPVPPGSPRLQSKRTSQLSSSEVSTDQPQTEGAESALISVRAAKASIIHETAVGKPTWVAGSMNKTSLAQRWETQTTANKTAEQKTASEPLSAVPLRANSKASEEPVSFAAGRVDKRQQKTVPQPSPSSSLLQAACDGGQPSWMELAKRKSLAWSDRPMN
ncbi:hypothetical protein DNTS_009914 [Danionella cerebrum]|uniref:DUF4592 domain-containing protein n=1 Tax=Danionella cerebrum TaxID=2873325 RepID=A0A553PUZ7_9TELE|nr:hypothetical protein DNTS_009914 [Danionella translucida]